MAVEVRDLAEPVAHVAAQVTLVDLQVIEVPADLDVLRPDGLADANRVGGLVHAVALVVDAQVERLEDQRDPGLLDERRDALEAVDHALVHLRLGLAGDVVAGEHEHHLRVEALRPEVRASGRVVARCERAPSPCR